MEYITVKDFAVDEFIEKKSRFIGYCKPVSTEQEAQDFIKEIKQKHKDATHNVWAYSLKEGGVQRYNDDGEPQGTAGVPVLDVLKKSNVVDCAVVATRYFGGIMLGGGGLVRAYSHTASIAVNASKMILMKECIMAKVSCPYNFFAQFEIICKDNNAVVDEVIYEDKVVIKFHILNENLQTLKNDYSNLTSGTGLVEEIDKNFYGFEID